jgi:glucosamine-6-phosphate deaminase
VGEAFTVDAMAVRVHDSAAELASDAAAEAADTIGRAIASRGVANVMFATGNSQLGFLDVLATRDDIEWDRIVGFHMDEYRGIPAEHPASFRRYLQDRIVDRVHPGAFQFIAGDAPDAEGECGRYAALLGEHPLDLCCLGIGENGHLAFNDPPVADFDDPLDVKVVALDEACRRQQVGEGHFATVPDVPAEAITVTIPALLRAGRVLAIVPDARKRDPVRVALTGPVTTACPASILRTRGYVTLHLDRSSAADVAA